MSSESSVLLIGLPAAGKTTFLAALWHQLESAEVPTRFIARELQQDREYLNTIRDSWLTFEEVSRTTAGAERSTSLRLRHVETGRDLDLSIPDIAGEVFAQAWTERQVPRSYGEQLRTSLGLVVFIHCRQVSRVQRLATHAESEDDVPETPLKWDPRRTPTQVQLIDSLQFALETAPETRVLRAAVVVSAWDEVGESVIPGIWLERELPLLSQFLRANRVRMPSKIFGVSAIGGGLADRDQLSLIGSPSRRPQIQCDSEMHCDLSLPLEFVTIGGS